MSDSQNALVVPTLDSYVVSCSCGWVGASHDSPTESQGPRSRAAGRKHRLGELSLPPAGAVQAVQNDDGPRI